MCKKFYCTIYTKHLKWKIFEVFIVYTVVSLATVFIVLLLQRALQKAGPNDNSLIKKGHVCCILVPRGEKYKQKQA